MVVRLGFAVATALAPDVLITDEVLAVGDESFQKKCVAWMEGYLAGGGTLLLCSHSMYHVQKLCRHALWLQDGQVERYRAPRRGDAGLPRVSRGEERAAHKRPMAAAGAAAAGRLRVQTLELAPGDTVAQGARSASRARSYSPGRPRAGRAGRLRARRRDARVRRRDRHGRRRGRQRVAGDRYRVRARRCRALALLPGKYVVRAHALDPEGVRLFDHVEVPLVVTGESRELGLVRLAHQWNGGKGASRGDGDSR